MTCMRFLELLVFLLHALQYSSSKSCHKDVKLNWTVSIGHSPTVSSPLNVKLNKNDKYELIVTSLDGTVSVIDTATGEEEPQWPLHFPEESFFAGPLLYDINEDGSLDILFTTCNGNIMFVSQNGTLMTSHTIALPWLMVRRKWYILKDFDIKSELKPEDNTMFISTEEYNKRHTSFAEEFVVLDTHILSTPVIGDYDGNGINNDLIIPVNYYFDDDVKSDEQKLLKLSLDKMELDYYQASGLIVIDLMTGSVIDNTTLELTMKYSSLPGYLLSSPAVIDLDGNHSGSEVVIGSSSGSIHVRNKRKEHTWSFDISDSIAGQIAVGDINSDGKLEVIAVDGSANVMCYSQEKLLWEASVSGTVTAGAQLYDVNNDNKLEVIIATDDGYIWVLDSQTGKMFPNWPVRLGNEIYSHVLFQKQPDGLVNIVGMSDGNLNILSGSDQCLEAIPTEEISYSPVIYDKKSMAFIVSSTDGAVLSFRELGVNKSIAKDELGIAFTNTTNEIQTITTANFDIEFEIFGRLSNEQSPDFKVVISYSTEKGVSYHFEKYNKCGTYSVSLPSPRVPKHTYIQIDLCNRFRQCTQDRIFITFHTGTKEKLVIYTLLPLLVMVSLLLLIHGFPEGDLLPMWDSLKNQ